MSNVERVTLPPVGATFDELCGFVGGIASVCSGKDLDDEGKVRVGKHCLVDAAGGTPSKPFEYLPTRYGNYRNVRGLLKGSKLSEAGIIKAYNPKDFYVFKCRAINLVWYQLSTHRANSPLKESLRYLPLSHKAEYEFPPFEKVHDLKYYDFLMDEDVLAKYADEIPPSGLRYILKDVYKRKELQSRDHNAFKLVNFYLCGTKDDFENMFNERSRNTKCQKETREFVQMIEDIVTAGGGSDE